jgi:4,5-dihydroxyphthalate decarboxylase
VRRTLVERHPWLPMALYKAFEEAKRLTLEQLLDPGAPAATLPLLDEHLRFVRALMGDDFWPYGLEPNRQVLETFLEHHHRQGLSPRRLAPEELFDPSVGERFRI